MLAVLRMEGLARVRAHADGTTHRQTANEVALIASFALATDHTLENWQITQILDMRLPTLRGHSPELICPQAPIKQNAQTPIHKRAFEGF